MLKDPFTAWDGPFPYDLLKPVGATPELPHAEMLEIPFELLSQGLMSPEANHAWEELRLIERRLFVDLMMYELDPATGIAAAPAAVERGVADPGGPAGGGQALRIPPGPGGRPHCAGPGWSVPVGSASWPNRVPTRWSRRARTATWSSRCCGTDVCSRNGSCDPLR